MITVTMTFTGQLDENVVQGIGMTHGTIVAEVVTEIIEAVTETIELGEMTPETGLGGGETILLTRSASLDEQTAEIVRR
jgi:hypothetical protein